MEDSNTNKFARTLRGERRRAQLSSRELAKRSGLPNSTISRMENGQTAQPRPADLQRLASALEVDVEVFYAAVGYSVETHLPELKEYLRSKYGIAGTAAHKIEGYVQAMREQAESTREGGEEDYDNHGGNTTT